MNYILIKKKSGGEEKKLDSENESDGEEAGMLRSHHRATLAGLCALLSLGRPTTPPTETSRGTEKRREGSWGVVSSLMDTGWGVNQMSAWKLESRVRRNQT